MDDGVNAMGVDHAFDEILVRDVTDEQRYAFGQIGGEAGGPI